MLTKQDWKAIGDPILHIELRRWADMVVVAPCSADMLAKIAAGFSDNLAVSAASVTPYINLQGARTECHVPEGQALVAM
jgi:phosphopantothenoylcysteine synthetase/decarboxylase